MEGLVESARSALATMICLQRELDPILHAGPDGFGLIPGAAMTRGMPGAKARGLRKARAPGTNRHRATRAWKILPVEDGNIVPVFPWCIPASGCARCKLIYSPKRVNFRSSALSRPEAGPAPSWSQQKRLQVGNTGHQNSLVQP
jgi:hypothetical protein